jgi:hypothetical protein
VTLPGWTRGLAIAGRTAFVGTSRVIPRYRQYAPGVDLERSESGVHAVDLKTGRVVGSIVWPLGNQIFGIEACPLATSGFPFTIGGGRRRVQRLFFQGTPQKRAPKSR